MYLLCYLAMQERIQAEAAKMVPDSTARLNKAAEELRELLVRVSLLDKRFKLTRG